MNRAFATGLPVVLVLASALAHGAPRDAGSRTVSNRLRARLQVEPTNPKCSQAPATIDVDFQALLAAAGVAGTFDPDSVAVECTSGATRLVAHRIDSLFGTTKATLSFVIPDGTCRDFTLYFGTVGSNRKGRHPFSGMIGDGDRFCEEFKRREIGPSHFDGFVDFDGDGDLDLFQGGVEPFVYCYENTGGNRLRERGRLSSGGVPFQLPCSSAQRSWVTVAFCDVDGDGDQDFIPSFGDGPDAGKFVLYWNTTPGRDGELSFRRAGPLQTLSGVLLAGGAQAGGWFPSITFVRGWAGGQALDALVGSKHRCWWYRGMGTNADGTPRFADAAVVSSGGQPIEVVNPRFAVADIDADADLDLFAGSQSGPVFLFKNIGDGANFGPGHSVAWRGKYLIGDAHSGVAVADFDGDGLLDLASGRFWARHDLDAPSQPFACGGFFKNVGTRAAPSFKQTQRGAPFTERFQPCDAIRQNSVRAVDWDEDGRQDLLAGDTDGFVWFFRNLGARVPDRPDAPGNSQPKASGGSTRGDAHWSLFAPGQKLRAGPGPLSVAGTGGHARLAVCDWDNNGRLDLVVADGAGTVSLFLNEGRKRHPALAPGRRIQAGGKPIQLRARASVLVCDWDNDGRKDVLLADEKGYYFLRNVGSDAQPLLAALNPVLFGGKPVSYVRPNLGAFVDWDGDGRRDLMGCHFENTIRFYRNLGSGRAGEEPQFADPEGIVLLQGEAPQMISGAEVLDWNGDGDLDLLTGQGHGGSGLRFYERDWLEQRRANALPRVKLVGMERRSPEKRKAESGKRKAETNTENGPGGKSGKRKAESGNKYGEWSWKEKRKASPKWSWDGGRRLERVGARRRLSGRK